ncbi:uncharacterized protein LOC132549333 [Ylistrum balloti]|uniref:uncharacterized protein LOC132549333 n=1 Tax=Ylistrum balloti TaxID=509963 RepID=UPI00290589A2|nr:uncharacterized protein LOC132549333 [Ylistrum balloti]
MMSCVSRCYDVLPGYTMESLKHSYEQLTLTAIFKRKPMYRSRFQQYVLCSDDVNITMGKRLCTTNDTSYHTVLKRAFNISVVGNILLVVCLLVVFVIRQHLRNQGHETLPTQTTRTAHQVKAGQICLPCAFQGQATGHTLYESRLKTENNITLCCLERDGELHNLIRELKDENRGILNPDRQLVEPEKLRWWRERHHAAHVYANPFAVGPDLVWSEPACKTSVLRNLSLTGNGRQLTVPQFSGSGLYFVYSMYTFDFSNTDANEPAPLGVHTIYKHRSAVINGNKVKLWTAKVGGVPTVKRQTSFLCGVVRMNMRDKIESQAISYVGREIYTSKHIDKSHYSNFFGMFKLIDFV